MGQLIVTPLNDIEPSLKKLLAKVTEQNIHAEIDWGFAEGKEL